jgi:hypothetical protein
MRGMTPTSVPLVSAASTCPSLAHPYRQPVELTDSWFFPIETKKSLTQVSPIAVSTRGGCAGLSDRVAGVTDEAHRY